MKPFMTVNLSVVGSHSSPVVRLPSSPSCLTDRLPGCNSNKMAADPSDPGGIS